MERRWTGDRGRVQPVSFAASLTGSGLEIDRVFRLSIENIIIKNRICGAAGHPSLPREPLGKAPDAFENYFGISLHWSGGWPIYADLVYIFHQINKG